MLSLQKATVAEILAHAEAGAPREVVGLVWADQRGVQMVTLLRNSHIEPERYYDVDPAELMSAYRKMEDSGGQPLAFYHSHPGGRPDPSEADMMGAMNVGMHYLIAYPDNQEWRLSTWECIGMQVLVEDTCEVTP